MSYQLHAGLMAHDLLAATGLSAVQSCPGVFQAVGTAGSNDKRCIVLSTGPVQS